MCRRSKLACLAAISLRAVTASGQILNPVLKSARGHAIQYYLSLPHGWTREKHWPVVVSIDGSGKNWLGNAEQFAKARNDRRDPFIVVVPLIVTNGGGDLRSSKAYNYSPAVWDQIDRTGRCAFDTSGLRAVLTDIRQLYAGEERYFITGFSAGGHLAWATIFQSPDQLAGAAVVEGNYIGRCVTSEVDAPVPFAASPERAELPVKLLQGNAVVPAIAKQTSDAMGLASAHGYRNISRAVVPGMGHVLEPGLVLEYFDSLLNGK